MLLISCAALVNPIMLNKLLIRILFITLTLTWSLTAYGQNVNWVSIQEAFDRAESEHKKIFIDMYTDWCKYCRLMDKNTFERKEIASYINEHFIPVKFNAEQKQQVRYKGHTYKFTNYGQRGYHQLATELCKNLGKLSYPTIIFLDENLNVIQPIPGYQDAKSFEVIMHYMAEDQFKRKPFRSYQASFKGTFN